MSKVESLINSLRFAGMKAEIEILAKARFTGEITYTWVDHEMRRSVKHIQIATLRGARKERGRSAEEFYDKFEEWISGVQGELRIYFTNGFIKQIEW